MKSLFLAAAAFGAFAATSALAEAPVRYVQGNIGAIVGGNFDFGVDNGGQRDQVRQDADGGVFASVAMGQSLNAKWTVEGEVIYAQSDMKLVNQRLHITSNEGSIRPMARVEDFTITTYGLMLNANYEVYRSGKTSAYVGAGAGFGYVDYEVDSWSLSGSVEESGLMWQLKAGLTRELTASTALDVSYRYLNTPQVGGVDEAADLQALSVGVRYKF